ncbi:rod-binding protein [Gymnodinialimonas ulvae]|uniref:rod-binding protein n=1 Tax=Gymnodinialimonas ulvae TaxID=3126504 RepID=UPI0030AD20EE
MPTDIITGATGSIGSVRTPANHEALREVAQDLEAAFLAEMLKHAGFGESRESFGGGIGEEQMTSLLRGEHANALAAQGGIGLAESIFQSLLRQAEAEQ